ncbi:hypothetical protein [Burkholderia cenocepacia]|uniref:hypothetical protein n=1 Tax=Burkholderia cenocepacia TaxID=95486 RepID=UPI0012B5748F|nr:hypothetical protein [Burkholderia cenocepacia]
MTKPPNVSYEILTREAEALIRDKMSASGRERDSGRNAFYEDSAFGVYMLWSRLACLAASSADRGSQALARYDADRSRLEASTRLAL